MRRLVAVLVAVPLVPLLASAATIHVPGDQPTIQAGIDAAAAGDTVLIACGTYYEHGIDMKNGVTLRSETGGPECVLIDGRFLGTVVRCEALDESSVLEGLTVTGGLGGGSYPPDLHGGGMDCREASPVVRGCVFAADSAGSGAGILCTDSSAPLFERCAFRGNGATSWGGGVFCRNASPARFLECDFEANRAYWGAGLCCGESDVEVSRCSFRSNVVTPTEEAMDAYGGGLLCYGSAARIEDCEFTMNRAEYTMWTASDGGGIACGGTVSPVISRCFFVGNRAYRGGGASCASHSTAAFIECTFRFNKVDDSGGGLWACYGSPSMVRCVFDANCSSAVDGRYDGVLSLDECLFTRNAAGVSVMQCALSATGCTFFANGGVGAACVTAGYWSTVNLTRCIVSFGVEGEAVRCATGPHPPSVTLSCCDIYGNAGGDWIGCIADQSGVDGNFSADPLFCDPGIGDFHLNCRSPCAPAQQPECGLIGAFGVGCGASATVPATWGLVKHLFQMPGR